MKCQMKSSFVVILEVLSIFVISSDGVCPRLCNCDDNKLRTVCESEAQLDYVPHTLNPALKELVLLDNHIRGIKSSLSFYRSLKLLDISRNQLTSLGENNFLENSEIEIIIVRTNALSSVENNTFNGLIALKHLDLSDNKIEELNPNTFRPLKNLEILDLSVNRISYISVDAFRGLQSLIELNLRSNKLNAIPSNSLQFVPNLQRLDFGSNSLNNVSKAAFSSLNSLSDLHLDDCALSLVDDKAFVGLTRLLHLRIQNNNLEEIPSKAFSDLVDLEELSIGENYFTKLANNVFSELNHLKTLVINKTETLSTIESGAFNGLSSLDTLELSHNKLLTNIDSNVLSDIPNLQFLILKANGLTSLELDFINTNNRQIFLDVRDNPFHCNCSLEWLRHYLLQTNTSAKEMINNASDLQISYPFSDFLVSISKVECESPPALRTRLIIDLNRDEFGCFELDTKIPIIIAILIGILLICGVIIIFVIRCKYGLSGLVKNQWFSGDNTTDNANALRNDLNYRKPEFVFIPNIDLNIDESNRAMEEAVRYPLKMTPITEL